MATQTATICGNKINLAPLDIIDYQKLLDRNPDEIQRLLKAARDVGFFHLDLNGAATKRYLQDLQQLYALQMQYFDQPLEMKMKHNIPIGEKGYAFEYAVNAPEHICDRSN